MIKKLTKEQLDFMYKEHKEYEIDCCNAEGYSKFQFLCNDVFNLWPYDSDIEEKWGKDLYEVMLHIWNHKCFDYWMVSDEAYNTYLIICQLLDMKHWIEWGTSIRHVWFSIDDKSDRLFSTVCYVSVDDPHYDEEGVAMTEENLKVLLDWMEE